jgi:hypothetical protein
MRILLIPLSAAVLLAQNPVARQGSSSPINFGQAPSTIPAKAGTSLPGTCTVGEQFFKTDATAGVNLYGCTATNVWTVQGTTGGAPTTATYILQTTDAALPNAQALNALSAGMLKHASGVIAVAVASDLPAHASRHQNGGNDEVATATPTANAIPKAGAGGTLATNWLPTSGVTPGTYGSTTQSAQITVDDRGRITVASSPTISGVAAGSATSDPANCLAGNLPRGVDNVFAAQGCNPVNLATEVTGIIPNANTTAVPTTATPSTLVSRDADGATVTYDKGGMVFNCKAYKAVGDGSTDDTAEIQACIDAAADAHGVAFLPGTANGYKISATLNLGLGASHTAESSRTHFGFVGSHAGWGNKSTTGGTRLLWYGAAGGTMVSVNGPIAGVSIENLMLDGCGAGASCSSNAADIGLFLKHPYYSSFRNLVLYRNKLYGLDLTVEVDHTTTSFGAALLDFENITVDLGGITAANGIRIGPDQYGMRHLDPARTYWRNIEVLGASGSGTGVELRFTDASSFDNLFVNFMGTGMKLTAPVTANLTGTVATNGTTTITGTSTNFLTTFGSTCSISPAEGKLLVITRSSGEKAYLTCSSVASDTSMTVVSAPGFTESGMNYQEGNPTFPEGYTCTLCLFDHNVTTAISSTRLVTLAGDDNPAGGEGIRFYGWNNDGTSANPDVTFSYGFGTNNQFFGPWRYAGANATAALPSYSFHSDKNTGMYRVSADTIGFSTNGVLRAEIGQSIVAKGTLAGVYFDDRTTATTDQWAWYADGGTARLFSANGAANRFIFHNNAGMQWTSGTEPTCNSTNRGIVVLVQGGAGVADTFRACLKSAGDTYAYQTLY